MYNPVFYKGELIFWTVCKGHVTDIGGPVPAGYNPSAKELYAEGLHIPPIKLWERGKERRDVVNFMLSNMRARRDQEGDLRAQYGTVKVGERNLIALLDKYGVDTVRDCVDELMDMADRQMRTLIGALPDGVYEDSAIVEDAGHGFGDLEIKARIEIAGEHCKIRIDSPPQIPYFINSYAGNSMSGVYLGVMMFAQVDPPYNEGLYRCIELDLGPKGTLCNAVEPAPSVNCTTTPMETLADAVRKAFEKADANRAVASWGHANGCNIAGRDRRTGEEYVSMILASIISGAGATSFMDGWHACGPQCCFGALYSGDIEVLEYSYPIIVHRYGLLMDSGGAGKFRGGSGTVWEVEPIGHDMTVVTFGEGRRFPALSAAGAHSLHIDPKVGRLEVTSGGATTVYRENVVVTIQPGERAANYNPGGGGYGDPFERPATSVLEDVRNGIVSRAAARDEYGLVVKGDALEIDWPATHGLRAKAAAE
jgi:N-methylhydantoinase B